MRKAKNRIDPVFQLGAGSLMKAGVLAIAASVALVMTLAVGAPGASAQANVQGTWATLSQQMLINPVHTALMANGKILIVSGSGNYPSQTTYQVGVWDPSTNTMTTGTQSWDQFCNGIVVFPDGRPFIVGGNLQYDPFHGWNRTTVYDPATGKYTDMQDMAHGRWYPTDTILGDGRLMTFSGLDEIGNTNSTVEIYTVGAGWAAATTAPFTPPLYPRMHLLPNGTVFYSGSTTQSRTFDPVAGTWSGVIATTNYGGQRTYGSSVLLPLTPGNGYAPKVMIFGGGNPSTATTEIIDLSAGSPAWVYGPNMGQPRIEMNATLLPTGKILTVGGSLNDEDTGSASLQADLYDVASNTMGSAGSNAFARLYHSVALLLPDATVWVAGGNPTRGSYEPHVEIYTPPYLYKADGTLAPRPTIISTSTNVIGYGGAFTVNTGAANIASVVLMKDGAATHAFDMEQRMVGLNFTQVGGVLTVTGPPNGNTAPPGYYMLFLIDNAGVPSVANFLQVSKAPNDVPPTGAITSPATDVTIAPGGTVTFAGTGTANTGTIAGYSWSIRGGTPATSAVQSPGVVTFATPGIYEASFTVTDSAGVNDPSPPTRTITVSSNPAPTVTSVAPTSALQGRTNLNVVLTGTGFLTGANCNFGTGIDVNSCTVNSATQITANIDVLSGATPGARDVTVTNSDSQTGTLAGGFTVTAGMALPAPTLTTVSPNSKYQGTANVAVVLTGTNFQPNPTCAFNKDVGGITNICTYVSATEIDATLNIAADAELGGHNVIVTNADGQSATLINGFTVTANLGPTVQLGTGFTVGALVLNGNAQLSGTNLQLTDGGMNEDASAWYATPVNVQNFVTDFTFQVTPGTTADGFTFALQNNNTAAIGTLGGGLGYGPVFQTDPPGILNSIAVKFDLYSNYGEGVNSTGLYVNGVSPSTPAVDMTTTPPGIDLHSGDIFAVHMVYDGTTLTMTITDAVTNAVFTHAWPIDIPTTVGASTAYAGFTGGTGGLTATQSILTWTLGPTSPSVGFTPTGTIDFPDTVKNVTSAPISVTVKNNGTAALHVTGVSFTGTNPTDFAAASDTCAGQTIAVNATCAVGVTFTPSGTGARAATLQIADDATGSPQMVSLTGNGLAPGTPVATITPASPVMFPSTTQGVAGSPMVFTVTNSGANSTLSISAVSVTGVNAGDFALSMNTCNAANLAANGTCTVDVTFTPGGVGARTATFQVADNAAGSPQTVTLTGTGTAAAPVVTTAPIGGLIFPSTTVNVTSSPMMEAITNSGNAILSISAITLNGANPGDFAIATNGCGATLAVNASCTVLITFKPTAAGARTASLAVADNANGSPQLVSIAGTGTTTAAPAVTITPTAVSFSATQGTNSSVMTVTVTNSGNAPLHVSSVTFGGANAADFVNPTGSCATAIAPNANCTIALSFAPVTVASTTARTETITITDDAPNSPQTVTVNGTVSASAFTLTSVASAQSATVTAGQTATYNLQLTSGAGFSGSVMWACTGAPATTTCTVTPNPVPLTSGAAATFAVNVTTTARAVLAPPSNRQPWPPAAPYEQVTRLLACLAMLALLYELKRRGGLTQRQLAYCGGALLLAVALYGVAGCASSGSSGGGGGGGTGTQAGTYTLTLTPTASGSTGKALQLSPVTLTLKVN